MSADRFPAPDPPIDPPGPRLRPAVSYYRQRGVIVTNHYFCAGGYRYEVAELSGLMRTRGSPHPGVLVGLVTAIAEAVVIVPLVSVIGAPLAWLLTFPALLVPCAVGYVCARRWPAQYELLATYRGREVTLFTSRDEREFGQVTRALQRAVEATTL
jgi:Family of unknown function (DUF6232)